MNDIKDCTSTPTKNLFNCNKLVHIQKPFPSVSKKGSFEKFSNYLDSIEMYLSRRRNQTLTIIGLR